MYIYIYKHIYVYRSIYLSTYLSIYLIYICTRRTALPGRVRARAPSLAHALPRVAAATAASLPSFPPASPRFPLTALRPVYSHVCVCRTHVRNTCCYSPPTDQNPHSHIPRHLHDLRRQLANRVADALALSVRRRLPLPVAFGRAQGHLQMQ